MIATARRQGILPQLYRKLFNDIYPDEKTEILLLKNQVKEAYLSHVRSAMMLSAELLRISAEATEKNLEFLCIKGPLLAYILYEDVTMRQYGDLDILVPPDTLPRWHALLLGCGYTPAVDFTPAQYAHLRRHTHETSYIHPQKGTAVELHWRLTGSDFPVPFDIRGFFKRSVTVPFRNGALPAPETYDHLLYLCVHGAKHHWERIEWLYDVAVMLDRSPIDILQLLEKAEKIDARRIVEVTLILCEKFFLLPIPERVRKNRTAQRLGETIAKTLNRDFFSPRIRKKLDPAHLMMLERPGQRLKAAVSMFQPTPLDYRTARLPEALHFLYYFIRPWSIWKRYRG